MTEQRRGRPRSDSARRAILDAAVDELREHGYRNVTIEGIAARAGAGKQTIYRWWPSKADVVLEAVMDLAASTIRIPDRGTLAADLPAFIEATFRQSDQAPLVVGLMAEALLDQGFARTFRERFIASRRDALRLIFERARARGELPPSADLDLLVDVVFGVLWYRLLVGHAPLTPKSARALSDLVLRAVGS